MWTNEQIEAMTVADARQALRMAQHDICRLNAILAEKYPIPDEERLPDVDVDLLVSQLRQIGDFWWTNEFLWQYRHLWFVPGRSVQETYRFNKLHRHLMEALDAYRAI